MKYSITLFMVLFIFTNIIYSQTKSIDGCQPEIYFNVLDENAGSYTISAARYNDEPVFKKNNRLTENYDFATEVFKAPLNSWSEHKGFDLEGTVNGGFVLKFNLLAFIKPSAKLKVSASKSATNHTLTVMPHSKKTTVLQTNDRNMKERKANASAKSKEVQPNAQADPQLHHICFCPTAPTKFIIH